MNVPFLFAFAILLASSDARHKPKLEIYEIRASDDRDDKIQINDLINDSEDRSDTVLSKLIKPNRREKDDTPRPKNYKLSKIVDALIHKLKSLRGVAAGSSEPHVYLINGNLIIDEEDGYDNNFVDETRSLPIIVKRKDIYELFSEPHRNKRPVLRGLDEDRTAPPPHRYIYDSDGSY